MKAVTILNIANTQQRGLPDSYRWKDETTQLDCLVVWRGGVISVGMSALLRITHTSSNLTTT
jgi:hypothetical protein